MSLPPTFDTEKGLQIHLGYLLELTTPSAEKYPTSFDSSNAYWTSNDKATFFASVARHSRWRPDLISEDLGGEKSTADVCSYINLLEQASAHNPTERGVESQPAAHEVSMEWIAIEEELAGQISANEMKWHSSTLKMKRDDELKVVSRSLREGGIHLK
jgi:hypothetical protein